MVFSYLIPTHIFDSIDSRWHEDIIRFIDSGDASEEFLFFLDGNPQCQNVVESAFTLVSQDIAATARQLKESGAAERVGHGESMNATFARLFTHMLLTLVSLDGQHREEILRFVRNWLPPQQKHAVLSVVNDGIDGRQLSLSLEGGHVS
jgi:hypothetical protein